MQTAKVFKNGNSQAVRLPREFRVSCDEMWIIREGETLVLKPKACTWESLDTATAMLEDIDLELPRDEPSLAEKDLF